MLKKQLQMQFEQNNFELFDFEQAYAEKQNILPSEVKQRTLQFTTFERCSKETEELIEVETPSFLQTPLSFFREHPEQFLYTESPAYETVRVDAVVVEFDEMFETYTALFGLKIQKKYEAAMRTYLDKVLPTKYSISFDGGDGLWEVNIYLQQADGDNTVEQTLNNIYRGIFELIEAVEEA